MITEVHPDVPPVTPAPELPRRRRRRQELSRSDKTLVAVIIIGLAVAAAAFGTAEPTTVPWADAAQRFVAVAVVALAGLRARRWTLVVGAALVTIFGSGFGIVVGFATLLVVVALTVIDKRSRIVGSAIAGLIALLTLFLSVPGPLGTEILVALLATVPILVSGYRIHVSSKSGRRRKLRRIMVAVLVVVAACLVATGVAAASSWSHIQSAMNSVQAGLKAAERGDRELSSQKFESAHDSFIKANRMVGSVWASSGLLLPVVGANLSAVQDSVNAGERLTATAGAVAGDIDFSDVQLQGGGVDLGKLAELGAPLVDANQTLGQVTDSLSALTSPWLVPPLADRLEDLTSRVEATYEQSETALLAVQKAPAILGADGPRRYLFLFGNPSESRDLGGHLGNWAEVLVDNGRLKLVRVGDPLDLAIPDDKAPKDLAERFPASLVEMNPTRFPHNWSSTRDLPTVAKLAAELFPIATGQKIDGVVYADVRSFAAFLQLTGPLQVPQLDPPLKLTQNNAVEFLTRGQFELFESESVAGDALEELIHTMFDKLTSSRLPAPEKLSELFAPLVSHGEFRMATVHPEDAELLERVGLLGEVRMIFGGDMLSVISRNAGPSKIDSFLRRDVSMDVIWNPESGGVESRITVDLHNGAPAAGLNRTISGNDASVPPGTNLMDLAVLTPMKLRSVFVDGAQSVSQPQRENSSWRYTVRVAIQPGADRVIVFNLEGSVDPGPHYVLSFNGQSLLDPGNVDIRVQSTKGRVMRAGEPDGQVGQNNVKFGGSLDRTMIWRSEGQ